MQLVVAATNQNVLYKKHMFCRKNVNKTKMRKIVSPAWFWKEMKASRRLAVNDIITRGVTVKIQQVAVRRNYENPSNDAKGEDE